MHVASCTITLQLYGVSSLKEKRRILKSLMTRLPQQFNVAIAEVDYQDIWQTAEIGLVTVGNDQAYLHGLLEKTIAWIERSKFEVTLESYHIEFL